VSRQKIAGLLTLGVGAVLGFAIRGPNGLIVGAIFLVVGLAIFFASEARGLVTPKGSPQPRVLVLLKEIHARPQKAGKFQVIDQPSDAGLEFEVFISCWFLNESDFVVQLAGDVEFSLETSGGARRVAERIPSDLDQWRLGSLVRDEYDTDVVRARQDVLRELDIAQPLQCGVPRHGWVHFRLRETSPAEFKTGVLRLSVKDSLGNWHAGIGKARLLPGRVWPATGASPATGIAAASSQ
jgi:hypothetical protein